MIDEEWKVWNNIGTVSFLLTLAESCIFKGRVYVYSIIAHVCEEMGEIGGRLGECVVVVVIHLSQQQRKKSSYCANIM